MRGDFGWSPYARGAGTQQPARQLCVAATVTIWDGPRAFCQDAFRVVAVPPHIAHTRSVPICTAWSGPRPLAWLGTIAVTATVLQAGQKGIATGAEIAGRAAGLAMDCQYWGPGPA